MQDNKFFLILLAAILLLPSCKTSSAASDKSPESQSLSSGLHGGTYSAASAALAAILPAYTDWQTAEVSGKLHMKKLPISPTIKIFMKKSEGISISVRASLLGEVGRIEITEDSVVAVNKMKRVYCAESISGIKYDYPDIIADIQSLLLGRAVVLRAGELSAQNADFLDFTPVSDPPAASGSEAHGAIGSDSSAPGLRGVTCRAASAWSLTYPKGRTEDDEFGYEYRINSLGQTERLLIDLATGDHDFSLSLDYTYPGRGFGMNISLMQDLNQKFTASLDFNDIRWEAEYPSPIRLNSRYTRLGIKQFLRSF